MRFEIGPGGMLVVLLGLLGLSGAVFGLGLIAGHELAGPETGAPPVAAAYPVPAAPAGSEEPSNSTASAPTVPAPGDEKNAGSDEGTSAATVPSDSAVKPPYPPVAKVAKAPATRHKPSSAQVASKGSHKSSASDEDEDLAPGSAVAPPSSSSSAPSETADTSGGDETEDDSAPPAAAQPVHKRLASVNPSLPASGGHPYSIQIDAIMDHEGAQQMEQKLRAKGFQPYMVPTQLGGKTWYRLRVGHYTTPADAQAAEAKLHQEFNDTPGH